MKIVLKGSGGLGGLRLEGEIDTADLPPELARRVERYLSSENLRSVAPAAPSMAMPDVQRYEVRLLPDRDDGAIEDHVVDDLCPQGEILDVIDDLMTEVRRRSRAGDG